MLELTIVPYIREGRWKHEATPAVEGLSGAERDTDFTNEHGCELGSVLIRAIRVLLFSLERNAGFQNPGRLALGTLRGLGEGAGVELESALATARGLDGAGVFGVLEALEQVEEIVLDVARRLAHEAGDLRDGHRIVEQQRDEVFAEHARRFSENRQ